MLGVCLLYVGIVLINNGFCRLWGVDGKSQAVMNIFTGLLGLIINVIALARGDFYGAGTGLLFCFTYLFVAANGVFKLDTRPYGIYSLFVAINAVVFGGVAFMNGDWRFCVIWLMWAVLWFTGFIETVLKKPLSSSVAYLAIIEGVITAWIPGLLMIFNLW